MPHFLISSKNIAEKVILINEPEIISHLCLSMRVKIGENIKLIDENQINYNCKIIEISRKEIRAEILNQERSQRKLPFKLNLVQCILKPDAQSLAISNAVQLGVSNIYPVFSDNVAIKGSKSEKWQKIANEAFKQCERADLATVHEPTELLGTLKKGVIIFGEKNANATLEQALKGLDEITAVVGPEGGFSEREFEFFERENYPVVSLGNLILKAPNAITAGLSNIIYEKTNG